MRSGLVMWAGQLVNDELAANQVRFDLQAHSKRP